jgi:acyl-CoA synthetase (AMP-forming)/AMP-acid ligase II
VQPAAVVDEARTKEWLTDATGDATTTFPEAPERPAILLFTSGTSAAPKAAVLHHENLLSYIFNTVEFASADEDEAVLLAVPPFHVAGVAAVLSSTYAGRRVVPLPNFSAEAWLRTTRDERVTHAFVVPTMLARIVSVMESDPDARVPTLRHLAYGGARMPAPVLERALRLLPDTGFVNAYGLTETSSTIAVLGPDDHRGAFGDDPRVRARLESVGRPVPGIEVAIVDPDGNALPAGERGEILVRGAQVGGGYVDQPSQLDDEGWLHTGDLGWIDDDGYLFVGGRADDVIIRGGENISPAEIEDALLRHPDVTGAAAVGLPDEEWGERVGAMVTLRVDADGDVDAIVGWARETLGSLKAPQVLVVCEELPTTATGKVLRRQVRDELAR